jgi:hypothetical protein
LQWIAGINLSAKVPQTSNAQLPRSFTIARMRSLAALLSLLALGGCARQDERPAPVACSAIPDAYARALDGAPGEVRVNGVRISDCLVKDASSADVQHVGATLLETARILAERGEAEELGYLVGAARRGARRSQGIHDEIVRRLEQEAGPLARTPGYGRGERAGRTSG